MKKFSNVKEGQKLWSIQLGECFVTNILTDGGRHNNIFCKNADGMTYSYGFDGISAQNHNHPSLFFSEIIEIHLTNELNTYPKMMDVCNDIRDKKETVIIYFELCGKYYGGRSSEEAGIVSYKDNPSVRITKWNFASDITKNIKKISRKELAKHFGADEVEITE